MKRVLVFITLLLFCSLSAGENSFPVSYKGRFRPVDVYSRLWFYDFYHGQKLKGDNRTPEEVMWTMVYQGHQPFDEVPFFWVQLAEIKKSLGLPLTQDRFSYAQLQDTKVPDLLPLIAAYRSYQGPVDQRAYHAFFEQLLELKTAPKEIVLLLENAFPLRERLMEAGQLLHALPGKGGQWYPLQALGIQTYNPSTNSLRLVENFTVYSSANFRRIQNAYLQQDIPTLKAALSQAYLSLAGKTYLKVFGKELTYPSVFQMKMESFYYEAPLVEAAILLYAFTIIAFVLALTLPSTRISYLALAILTAAFLVHTLVLIIRCYILERPPVSNMFETVIYVPWVALIASFAFWLYFRRPIILLASSLCALGLLILLKLTNLNSSMENVQAVLNSQYWLIIHVLLVVGSYGLFILAGILGQIYLGVYCFKKQKSVDMHFLAQSILQTMYLGVALLIPGTILGGVWAAESWGRFWDWDPKESWAFISSCVYLIWIHAYMFNKIGPFGLAVGSVIGLMTISFTWYGVNYILGTGLHSYGFGSGGEGYYYLFLTLELFFIILASIFYKKEKKSIEAENKIVL